MQFTFAGIALTDADSRAANISLAGNRVIDEADFIGATQTVFYDRNSLSTPISFETSKEFSTLRLAEKYALRLNTDLPRVGALVVTVGEPGDTENVTFANAALKAISKIDVGGVRVYMSYQFKAGRAT